MAHADRVDTLKANVRPIVRNAYRAGKQTASLLLGAWHRQRARRALRGFQPPHRLHVGCGTLHFDGWINIDVDRSLISVDRVWDLRFGVPGEDRSAEFIYSEHMLEHLTVTDGLAFLRECRRVLRADGVLRVAMPSLDYILERATSTSWRDQEWLTWPDYSSIQTRAEMINVAFRAWGHQYLYDREELHRRLKEAGFVHVVDATFGASEHPELRNRESRKDSILICEARS